MHRLRLEFVEIFRQNKAEYMDLMLEPQVQNSLFSSLAVASFKNTPLFQHFLSSIDGDYLLNR